MAPHIPEEIIRPRVIHEVAGISSTTVWRLEKLGQFPARRQLSPGTVGWLRSEVEAWLLTRGASTITSPRTHVVG
ncbi:MAG: AlpA family phage regulatory protein [Deferrisomatales bacterium]|nr:AlpA family phage regulatory protein [Deferrisomatales bacterium]